MEVAKLFQRKSAQAKRLKALLKIVNGKVATLEAEVLELIENERLPSSFKLNGTPIYTSNEIWASARKHDECSRVLKSLGLIEFLPGTVNSQAISAYVREHYNDATGEFDLPQELLDQLNITQKTRVKATGL